MKKTGKNMMKLTMVILLVTIIVLVGIIINILNTNNTINKQEEASMEQLTQTASSNAYVDMETHLSEVSNSASSVKKAVVFTSSPVDMTQYTDRWAELTTADFRAGASSIYINVSSSGGSDYGSSGSFTQSPTFNYNNTTGQLTFNKISWNRNFCDNTSYNTTAFTHGNANIFVVWLGTVNGQ